MEVDVPHHTRPRGARKAEPPLPDLSTITREHRAYVLALLERARAPDAEDLAHEVLIRVSRFRGAAEGLLVTTTRFVLLESWKAERARARLHADLPIEATMGTVEHPEAAHEAAERIAIVHAAVADLPEPLRSTFIRCVLHEETATALAAELGIPRETVTARLARANEAFLAALRKHMLRRRLRPEDV